jgi:hypothetical protein
MRAVFLLGLWVVVIAGCDAHAEPVVQRQPDAGGSEPTPKQPTAARAMDAGEQKADVPDSAPIADVDVGTTAGTTAKLDAGAKDAGPRTDAEVQPAPDAQPGIAGNTVQACPTSGMREVGPDDPTSLGTARALRDAFTQAVEMLDPQGTPFRWSARFGGTTTIEIGAITWGDKAIFTQSDQQGCEDLRVPASIRLRTQDGKLDESAQGFVRGTQFTGSFAVSGKLSEWLVDQASYPGLAITSIGVFFSVDASQPLVGEINANTDIDDYDLVSDLYGLGKFDSTWVRGVELDAPYKRAAPIDDMCTAAAPADVSVSFSPGIADLSSKLSRVWLRCNGASTGFPEHDGIAITATGWKHLAYRDGAWIEQLGFGHEGTIQILDTSINGPGSQQVVFWDMLPFTFASPSVDLSSSASSLHLAMGGRGMLGFDGLYIASDVTVGTAEQLYADGVRAGAAACDKAEAHLHRIGAPAEVNAALAGSWTFCSGSFRPDATGIEFSALGTYNHLAADGGTVASGLYQVIDTGDFNGAGSSQINLSDLDGGRHIMSVLLQSDAPIKLSFGLAEGRGVLSAR